MTEKRGPALWRGYHFVAHFWLFAIVLPVLAIVDLLIGDAWWVHWALFGWGAAVLVHAFFVFGSHRAEVSDLADGDQQRAA